MILSSPVLRKAREKRTQGALCQGEWPRHRQVQSAEFPLYEASDSPHGRLGCTIDCRRDDMSCHGPASDSSLIEVPPECLCRAQLLSDSFPEARGMTSRGAANHDSKSSFR